MPPLQGTLQHTLYKPRQSRAQNLQFSEVPAGGRKTHKVPFPWDLVPSQSFPVEETASASVFIYLQVPWIHSAHCLAGGVPQQLKLVSQPNLCSTK